MTDQKRLNNILLNAIVDGCTGAAFFGKLRWLGASTSLIDYRTSGNYLERLKALKEARNIASTASQQGQTMKQFNISADIRKGTEASKLAPAHGRSPSVA